MADIPTIAELQSQIENDLKSELGIVKTWFGKVMLKVLSIVQASKLKLYYLAVGFIQKNLFVDTATDEFKGGTLQRFGRVKLGRDPYPAIAGIYTLTVTGSIGGTIEKGRTFVSSTNKIYEVQATVILTGSSGTVTVKALEAGMDAALTISDTIELTAPIANINSTGTIASVLTTPVAVEDLESYRQLIIDSFQLEPQGGAATDYRIWAADVSGVRTVYPYTKNGAIYTVQVFTEALPASSAPGQPKGVPPSSMLTDVTNVIELDPDTTKELSERGRRPLQATIEVLAVVPVQVTVTVNGLSDKTTPVKNAITQALEDLFYTIRPYIPGADGATRKDTLYLSNMIAAIFEVIDDSVNFSNVEFSIGGVTYSQYTFGNAPVSYGKYPYLFSLLTP